MSEKHTSPKDRSMCCNYSLISYINLNSYPQFRLRRFKRERFALNISLILRDSKRFFWYNFFPSERHLYLPIFTIV